jgi:uncharacterized membrane protein YdbT with pleckstrin-like domain
MGFSEKLLGEGEHVILHTRTHWKALVLPTIVLLVVAAAGGFLLATVPTWADWIVLAVAVVLLGIFVLKPFLQWMSSTDTLTNRRLITRSGVFTRHGRDIPLRKINDVSIQRGVLDRLLGCGTVTVESAGERGQIVLHDVPDAEVFHLRVQEQLLAIEADARDEGGYGRAVEPPR